MVFHDNLCGYRPVNRNFMHSGSPDPCVCPIHWSTCILPKAEGGLVVTDIMEQTKTLLSKWVARAYYPLLANWKIMMRHRFDTARPLSQQGWPLDAHMITTIMTSTIDGSPLVASI